MEITASNESGNPTVVKRRRRWRPVALVGLLLALAAYFVFRSGNRVRWEIEVIAIGPTIVSPEDDVLVRRGPVLELIDRRGDTRELNIESPFMRPVASAREHGFIAISEQRGFAETALIDWTGRKRWSLPVTASPVVAAPGGLVYLFCRPGTEPPTLQAVQLDGVVAWSLQSDGRLPIALQVGADDSLAFRDRGGLQILNRDGTTRWSLDVGGGLSLPFAWDASHGLAVGNRQNSVEYYSPDGIRRWSRSITTTNSVGLTGNEHVFGVAIGPTGLVYCHASGGSVHVFDADGERRWSYPRGTSGMGGDWIAFTEDGDRFSVPARFIRSPP